MIGTGIIASARRRASWSTGKAIAFNGVDEMASVTPLPMKSDTTGCWLFDATLNAAAAGTANDAQVIINAGVYLSSPIHTISFRRNTGFGDTNYRLDVITSATTGGYTYSNAGNTTTITPGTRYRCCIMGNGTIWINGVSQSLVSFVSRSWASGKWYSWMSGAASAFVLGFGGSKTPGGTYGAYGNVKLDNAMYLSRVLTSGEVTEWYNSGVPKSPASLSFYADIQNMWLFQNDLTDPIGGEDLTGENLDSSNYV